MLSGTEYVRPSTMDEASGLLASDEGAVVLAGGTDVLVAALAGRMSVSTLVDVSSLPELKGVEDWGDCLWIGALTTMTKLCASDVVNRVLPGLGSAAAAMGCWQVRNRATIGGNLCNASPSAEMGPPLLVYEAAVDIDGVGGKRRLPISDFFKGPGETALAKGELVTGIRIPKPDAGLRVAYVRRALRRSMDIPLVNVAAGVQIGDGVVVDARVALGAVAPVPFRVPVAEEILVGRPLTDSVIQEAAEGACCPARPITDVRATAEYRLAMVEVLVRRALIQLAEESV